MPRYPRTVIPGRTGDGADLDRLVFGDSEQQYDALPEEEAVEEEHYDEVEDEEIGFVERGRHDRRRSRGRRRDDFAALPDGDGAYAEGGSNGRGMVLLVGIVVICGVFGAVVWNAYRGGIRPAEASPAPMLSASGPIKTRLTGEAPAPGTIDADVFGRMEAEPVVREPEVERAPEPVEVAAAEPEPEPTPEPVRAEPEPAPVPEVVVEPAAMPEPEPVRPAPVAAPAPAPKPEPKPPVQLAGAFAPNFVPGAAHVVQIGATDTLAKADAEYARIAKAAPDLFAGAERVVVPVQVNGNQMYRIRVGSFASAEDANAFCSAYKARVGDCYRATR